MEQYTKSIKYVCENGVCRVKGRKKFSFAYDVVITPMYKDSAVSSIGANAFENDQRLTSIVIPEGVVSIGAYAFSDCKELSDVVLPSTLESIGEGAFSNCTSLRRIQLPSLIVEVPKSAFEGCTGLRHINLGGVRVFGENAFSNCTSLAVDDLSSAEVISHRAFAECDDLKDAVKPKGKCQISPIAFEGMNRRLLGELWRGNALIEQLFELAHGDFAKFEMAIYNMFLEYTRDEDPLMIREMFCIYLGVMREAGALLGNAGIMTYLLDEHRAELVESIFRKGDGKIVHAVMRGSARLYSFMSTRVIHVDVKTVERLVRRVENEPNRSEQAYAAECNASLFADMLDKFHPDTGERGHKYETSSMNFGFCLEDMDDVFARAYYRVECDAYAKV